MRLFTTVSCFLLFTLTLQAQLPDSVKALYPQLNDYTIAARLAAYYSVSGAFDSTQKYASRVLENKEAENTLEEIKAHNHLTRYYLIAGDYKQAQSHNQKSVECSEKQSDAPSYLAQAYLFQGIIFYYLGELSDAELAYRKSLGIYLDLEADQDAAALYLNLGVLDKLKGDYGKAIENYQQAMLLYEQTNDTLNMAKVLNNIGNVNHKLEQDYIQALAYYERAFLMFRALEDSLRMADLQNNMGEIYLVLEDYEKAKNYFFSSLNIFENSTNVQGIASTYHLLGAVYSETNKLDKALEFYSQSKNLYTDLGDARNILLQDLNLAEIYFKQQQYPLARSHYESCLGEAQNRNLKDVLMEGNKGLSEVYEMEKRPFQALKHYKLYSQFRDSLLSENTQQIVQDLQTKYETDKKQKQLEYEQTQNKLLVLQNKRNRGIIIATISILVVILGLSTLLYRLYFQKKKANYQLQVRNQQIRDQHDQIKQQAEQIQASIRYASLIQSAILPPSQLFEDAFDGYFILYKPCEVVSGDFYWMSKQDDTVVIVCADCTGHGVPGAFMSMLGMSAFTHVIGKESGKLSSDIILNEVRDIIIAQLHQSGNSLEGQDGMDLSICIIDRKAMQMQVSGAYNPIYFIRENSEIEKISCDRMPIGYSRRNDVSFTKTVIDLQKGDRFYLFSDGFPDQFGSKQLKRYKSKPFREFIAKGHQLPMKEQGERLEQELYRWMEGTEQIDDITVIGIRV